MQTIHIDSLDELPHAAAAVINALEGRSVVVFRGEMGAGKTTLIREIVARLGADDTVTSPTFAIVNQYTTREGKNIYHFDFYRINRLEEAYDFGYEEYFYSGNLCLVEWPEKIEELLPEEVMTARIASATTKSARSKSTDSRFGPISLYSTSQHRLPALRLQQARSSGTRLQQRVCDPARLERPTAETNIGRSKFPHPAT